MDTTKIRQNWLNTINTRLSSLKERKRALKQEVLKKEVTMSRILMMNYNKVNNQVLDIQKIKEQLIEQIKLLEGQISALEKWIENTRPFDVDIYKENSHV